MQYQSSRHTLVTRSLLAIVFAAAIAGAGFSATRADAAPATLVNERGLAQQGLAVGFSFNLVHSQLTILTAVTAPVQHCTALPSGGSVKKVSSSGTPSHFTVAVVIYYANNCTKKYIDSSAIITVLSATVRSIKLSATIYDQTGAIAGVLHLNQTGTQAAANLLRLSATGTFAPNPAGATAKIAYNCSMPVILGATNNATCNLAIAQTFSLIQADIASTISSTLHINKVGQVFKVTFTAPTGHIYKGASGALGATTPTATSVAISGPKTALFNTAITGSVARFALFSPGPVNWSSIATGFRFDSVMGAAGVQFNGTVKRTSPTTTTLATFNADKGGMGHLTYSNHIQSLVKAWTLSK